MRENAATEDEAESGGGSASRERRPSLVALQNMLKKVSQSPFHNQYQTLVSSASDSSGSSANESRGKQDGEFLIDLSAAAAAGVADDRRLQNGGQERLHLTPQKEVDRGSRMNPFHVNYLESGGEGHVMEDAGGKTSKEVFVPPPEFQSSPLDVQSEMRMVKNEFPELSKDLFQTVPPDRTGGRFQTPTWSQDSSANGHFHDVSPNSPDLFKAIPTRTTNLSKTLELKSSEPFKDEGLDLFQAAKGEDSLPAERTRDVNLFDESPSISADPFKEDVALQSCWSTTANQFFTEAADSSRAVPPKGGEVFHFWENEQDPSTREDLFSISSFKDVFSSSSTNTVDPFPSPITRDLFQDVSSLDDPFSDTPSRQYNPFHNASPGTLDILKPLPPKPNGRDSSGVTSGDTGSDAKYSTPLLNSPSDMNMLSSTDLFKATPSEFLPATRPKSSDVPRDIILTTPRGTEHDILQPSPFSRARNLSISPSHSPSDMTHVTNFKRPPKPLPRSRPPRPGKPPVPEKPPKPANPIEHKATASKTSPEQALRLPKPVVQHKPKTPETKPLEPEDADVFENVLLIGQERCVEDWPEDSPELNPDFKPSGALRLRRESLKMKVDSEGGSGDDHDGSLSYAKKKDKKFRLSLLSRRGSKEKFPDDTRSKTLPPSLKSPKGYFSEENEDGEQNGMDYKKKSLNAKVGLLRKGSAACSPPAGKHVNGHFPQESKQGQNIIRSKSVSKKDAIARRWPEGTSLNGSTCEEEEEEEEEEGGEARDSHGSKMKKKVKIRFVPQRGFSITLEKKGARGSAPRRSAKDKSQDEYLGAHGYTPRTESQDHAFAEARGLQSTRKASFLDDERFLNSQRTSAGMHEDEDPYGMEDSKPRKKAPHAPRGSSKEDALEDAGHQKKKSSFSADDLDDEDWMEDRKPKTSKDKGSALFPHKSQTANGPPIGFSPQNPQQASNDPFAEDDFMQTGKYFKSPGEMNDSEEDEVETCKAKKTSKFKGFKKHGTKSKAAKQEFEDPPGAASSDFLSEAAKAEWQAAQMDERAMAGLEDDDQDGDTDSLMEWWNTVEQWDEVPSDDEDKFFKEDESRSFIILADKVHRGLRVFNKVFTERAEILWQSIIRLHAIADNINNFHHKAKIAGITGGTTTAVGGVTAIAGLALAPFTFGASLVMTAVGVGVATAGGIASASAAISDNVHNMHDRKKVEIVLEEYEIHLQAIGKILHFVNQGLYKLRGHPFLRSGTQHYSQDWEIRRAVQMISLVDSPVMRGTEVTDTSVASVQGLFMGMDKYFIKDSRELKKGCKKEVVGQIKQVANVLNDGIVELNAIREELQDATGNM